MKMEESLENEILKELKEQRLLLKSMVDEISKLNPGYAYPYYVYPYPLNPYPLDYYPNYPNYCISWSNGTADWDFNGGIYGGGNNSSIMSYGC